MMHTLTEQSITARISNKFNVLKTFSMHYYVSHLDEFYNELLVIKKECFSPNDRIVFMFSDTDYYLENQIGLGLFNTYKIINYLNIPTFCCLIVTQQDYIKHYIHHLNQTHFFYDNPINIIETYIDTAGILDNITPTSLNVNNIKKSFTYLSWQYRKHRAIFYSLLSSNNLLDIGQVSFRSLTQIESTVNKTVNMLLIPDDLLLVRLTNPLIICNDNWALKNNTILNIFKNFLQNTPSDFVFKNFIEQGNKISDFRPVNPNLIQSTFLYIAAETMFEYPGSYLTEKSFKGIACMRPFIVLGPPYSLKKLQSYGFKTFSNWWNEDYDNITDSTNRLESVFKLVEFISKKPINELKEICNNMSEVLYYNYHHLINNFVPTQLKLLDKQCLEYST